MVGQRLHLSLFILVLPFQIKKASKWGWDGETKGPLLLFKLQQGQGTQGKENMRHQGRGN